MKKFLLFLSLCIMSVTGFCEDVIGYYNMSYFSSGSTCQIEASKPKNGDFTYFIQIKGEKSYDKVYISLESKEVDRFIESLNNIKSKYIEWCNIAKSNNVTDMSKEFPFKLKISYAWLGAEWWFSGTYVLSPKFMVLDSGQMVVALIKTAKAFDNEYIKKETYLVLSSAEEIDTLISALDTKKVFEHYNSQKNKESLFE